MTAFIRHPASCLLLAAASFASAAPLPTRDQNPLLAGFGLSRPMPPRLDESWQWSADFNWGSSAIIQNGASERLIVDAETRELRLTFDGRLNERWLLSASVPWRSTSAGTLDDFIDDWHDFFHLPSGDRNQLSTDALRVLYQNGTGRHIDRRNSMYRVGDIDIAAGRQLIATRTTALTAWFDAKLPTGSYADLTGSEALDLAVIVAGEHRFDSRWSVFGQMGITRLGRGDVLPEIQRDWVGSAMAGVSRRLWRSLDVTVQFDAHTAAFDSQLDYLGDTVILNFGGTWHFDNGLQLSLGISEDIVVEGSPDVVFVFGVRGAL